MTVASKLIQDLTTGYTLMVQEATRLRMAPTLLTFMFNHLSGSPSTVDKKMGDVIE
ncbi:hypothetical protein [Mesorhizobium sp.]|uniref:hypothetical protein n=1 Tax=Mesorhizobium sp. TaxID=1871066 RepID=UPI00257F6603|nr:hypothetical protein [Mesorhizobium sp.]